MLSRVELRHLRYYVAVAEEENVSRAALRLHVSQPALSRQIRDLEEELGFFLLERGAKSVSLTDAGRVFLKEAKAVLDRTELAVEKAREVARGAKGELHIGYAPSLTPKILPRVLRAYQTEQKGIKVLLHDLSTEEMLTKLRDGTLHIALTIKPTKATMRGMCYEELATSPTCVAVHREHAFAKRKTITLLQAVKEPMIGYNRIEYPEYHEDMAALFAPTKAKFRIVEEYDSATSLIAAVEAGGGVAIVPGTLSCIAGERLKLIPLEDAEPLSIGATWSKEGLIPSANRFLQLAIDLAAAEKNS